MTFNSLHIPGHFYMITASIRGWKSLFFQETYANVILDSLIWLRANQKMYLFAFALMPSHLHMIVKPNTDTIGILLQRFGSFTAHKMIRVMKENREFVLLEFFEQQRGNHEYHLWNDIQAKNLFSLEVLEQKLEYIHNNPVAKDWHLVERRDEYRYSSACFYDLGKEPIIKIDDIREYL